MRTIQGHASLGLSEDAPQRLETCLQMQAWLPFFDYKLFILLQQDLQRDRSQPTRRTVMNNEEWSSLAVNWNLHRFFRSFHSCSAFLRFRSLFSGETKPHWVSRLSPPPLRSGSMVLKHSPHVKGYDSLLIGTSRLWSFLLYPFQKSSSSPKHFESRTSSFCLSKAIIAPPCAVLFVAFLMDILKPFLLISSPFFICNYI